jgi:hypothetical protein
MQDYHNHYFDNRYFLFFLAMTVQKFSTKCHASLVLLSLFSLIRPCGVFPLFLLLLLLLLLLPLTD